MLKMIRVWFIQYYWKQRLASFNNLESKEIIEDLNVFVISQNSELISRKDNICLAMYFSS